MDEQMLLAVQRRISTLFELSGQLARQVANAHGDYVDAVAARNLTNEKAPAYERRHPIQEVIEKLGHIPVNPSNTENTQFLINSYVYLSDCFQQPSALQKSAVNFSGKAARRFLDVLVECAKAQRRYSLEYGSRAGRSSDANGPAPHKVRDNRVFSLIGPKGSGKTFFLNHLFAKQSKHLDAEKVVWVRLNLVTDRGYDSDLSGWARAQIAKILLRYYEHDSEYAVREKHERIRLVDHLEKWIRSDRVSAEDRAMLREKLHEMRHSFCFTGGDVEISPAVCHANLCKEIFKFARESGLSFIVVFDGLDRLDNDSLNRRRFVTLTSQFQQLCVDGSVSGAAYLVVCRTYTFRSLRLSYPHNPDSQEQDFHLEGAELTEVIGRRGEMIANWLDTKSKLSEDRERYFATSKLFAAFRSSIAARLVEEEFLHFSQSLMQNNRAKVHVIGLWFQEFCQFTSHFGYRLLELMVKSGFVFPPIVYRYRRLRTGQVETDSIESAEIKHAVFDSRFLPVITRPPAVLRADERVTKGGFYGEFSPLHGVRILQLLLYGEKLLRDGEVARDPFTVDEICRFCEEYFDFSAAVTRCFIYELESFEMVHVEREEIGETDSDYDTVELLPKGKSLLENYLFSVAYLNLCAMRTLVPESVHNRQFFMPARLGRTAEGARRAELQTWVHAKISNAVCMATFLRGLDQRQQQKIALTAREQSVTGRLSEAATTGSLSCFFGVFDTLESAVLREINAIVRSEGTREVAEIDVARVVERLHEIERSVRNLSTYERAF